MVTLSNNKPLTSINPNIQERKAQRIKIFIILLSFLGIPGVLTSVSHFRENPLPTLFTILPYFYYIGYYKLTDTKYANLATYICFIMLNIFLVGGLGVNIGPLTSLSIFFVLLLIGISMVLGDQKSLDIMSIISFGTFIIFITYQITVKDILLIYSSERVAVITLLICTGIAIVGTWYILRINLQEAQVLNQELVAANQQAELRAQENEQLLSQVHESHETLMAMQDKLQGIINQLSLPMIKLGRNIALLPLIGYLDEQRSQIIINRLLEDTDKYRINIVVLELTGLQMIDDGAVVLLQQAIRGLQLLGAQAYISGINSQVADKLISEGNYLLNTPIVSSLAEALEQIASSPITSKV